MTLDEFLTALAATRGQGYRWYLHGGSLRAVHGADGGGPCYCPLTAVYAEVKHDRMRVDEWEDAASGLGLSTWEMGHLVAVAADGPVGCEAGSALRRRLFEAVGLETRESEERTNG